MRTDQGAQRPGGGATTRLLYLRTGFLRPVVLCLPLAGCIGDQRNQMDAPQRVEVQVPVPDRTAKEAVDGLRGDLAVSQNNTSNSLTGLGVQVSKVAERVQGFGGDLVRLEASIEQSVRASLKANAEIEGRVEARLQSHAEAIAQVDARVRVQNEAIVSLRAEVSALAAAQAQGIAGVANRLDSVQTTVAAGRDSHVETVQFSKEVLEALRSDNRHTTIAILGMALLSFGIVVVMQERSRRRAEDRFRSMWLERRWGDREEQ